MLTKDIEQMVSTFQDHINEGKITPDHRADCGYCKACRTAIDLVAELDRMKAALADERESAVRIRNMTEDYATIDGDVQKLVIVTLWKLFHESGAENYLVMNINHNDEPYELTMQKKGMLSPSGKVKVLQAEIEKLKSGQEWIRNGVTYPLPDAPKEGEL